MLASLTGCTGGSDGPAESLAFAEDPAAVVTTTTRAPTTTTTTAPPPVPLGSPGRPFTPLADEPTVRAVRSPTGIALSVLGEQNDGWVAMSVCELVVHVDRSAVSPIERAHVVLDPGHGGTEVGAVGPEGTRESDLNLAVAEETARLLRLQGASVVLTRENDHNVTTRARGVLAASLDPALFVSIHHNGGAPRSGTEPGTIVFTKTASPPSTRFGGLFFASLNTAIQPAAERRHQDHLDYLERLSAYEAQVDAYDQSVLARDAALLANGQITETTTPGTAPEPVDGLVFPRERNPIPTTTSPPRTVPPTTAASTSTVATTTSDTGESGTPTSQTPTSETTSETTIAAAPPQTVPTVPVPETLPVPEAFDEPPVREFLFRRWWQQRRSVMDP